MPLRDDRIPALSVARRIKRWLRRLTSGRRAPRQIRVDGPDPYRLYARLRAQGALHYLSVLPLTPAWLVVRYAEALVVFRDPRFVKDPASVPPPSLPHQVLSGARLPIVGSDPPEHTRLRALLAGSFTPRTVEGLAPRIQQLSDQLLDQARPNGQMDLIRDYASVLPMTVIAEMVGVPIDVLHGGFDPSTGVTPVGRLMVEAVIAARRSEPRDDLISALLQAEREDDRLTADQVVRTTSLILMAGYMTTVNLIGNGALALLRHADQLEMLRHDPGLIDSAVEELLRFESPLALSTRHYAATEVELGGTRVPHGSAVHVAIGSANRDERRFSEPDRLDITRDASRHVAFGQGIHYCLGSHLARLQGRIALLTLIQRLPGLQLGVAAEQLVWHSNGMLRGLRRLPVRF